MGGTIRNRRLDGDETSIAIALRRALASYDSPTGTHSGRVGDLAALIAPELELDSGGLLFPYAGFLHDLGKLGLPKELLSRPGPLSERERKDVERHPIIGSEVLLAISEELAPIAAGVRAHHERWDGLGYPDGLSGTRIPPLGRLLAVVDVYDVLTHRRSYRSSSFTRGRAMAYLSDHSGMQFDPDHVGAAVAVLRAQHKGRRQFAMN